MSNLDKVHYHLYKQPCGRWMYYDVDGLFGDKLLTKEVLKEYILPQFTVSPSIAGCTNYIRAVDVVIQGYGKTTLALVLSVTDELDIAAVRLMTRSVNMVIDEATQFMLTLPRHDGTDWPYPPDGEGEQDQDGE
jgi:hypothetical protein